MSIFFKSNYDEKHSIYTFNYGIVLLLNYLDINNTELVTKMTTLLTSNFYKTVEKNQFKNSKEVNANDNDRMSCEEALTSAVVFTSNGERIGRFIVRPDRRPIKHQAYNNRLIRIEGKLNLTLLQYFFFEYYFN